MANVEKTYWSEIYSVELDEYDVSIKFWIDCTSDYSEYEILSIQDLHGVDVLLSLKEQNILYNQAIEAIQEFNKEN